MFGRLAQLPIEADTDNEEPSRLLDAYLEEPQVNHWHCIHWHQHIIIIHILFQQNTLSDLTTRRLDLLSKVKENILAAQGKQKQTYDRKHANLSQFRVRA